MTAPGQIAGAPPPGDEPARPVLSVVVAAIDADYAIDACLDALSIATSHISSDIVVVDASTSGTRSRAAANRPNVRVFAAPPGTLVPRLWSRGYAETRGTHVAFTLAQCRVEPTWARSLLAAMDPGVAGAGGAFALALDTGPAAWALFFLRYSAFISEHWHEGPVAGEIAGDNALYRRADLETCAPFEDEGFWEVEIHRQLRLRGSTLAGSRGATAVILNQPVVARLVGERFRHGRHFAAERVRQKSVSRVRIVLAMPLVPAVLVWRAARRVLPHRARCAR